MHWLQYHERTYYKKEKSEQGTTMQKEITLPVSVAKSAPTTIVSTDDLSFPCYVYTFFL